MSHSTDVQKALEELDFRLRIVLPEEYQDTYEQLQPVSMGSAGLKYAMDGTVAWNEIWGSFCDLAMAGGPPHKGALLEQGRRAAIHAEPDRYRDVVAETCRGATMVTELPAEPAPDLGWVRVECFSEAMTSWLLRAVTMENVAVRAGGRFLDLPVAAHFRLEKEIKNVITVIAKTCHYWMGHMPVVQQRAIADLFTTMAGESPLITPEVSEDGPAAEARIRTLGALAGRVRHDVGLRPTDQHYAGWLGVECANVADAVWMMRALVANNVLSRREGTVLFVPVNPETDPTGERVARALSTVRALASCRA